MVIVGLGNPGGRYEGTRHNVGFELVDRLVDRWSARGVASDPSHHLYEATVAEVGVSLLKPMTYMNRSGIAIRRLMESRDLDPSTCLVAVDDMFLDTGRIRFRPRGGSGGHNGLESIAETFETNEYPRLRIGVGPAPEAVGWSDFVLGSIDDEKEREQLNDAIGRAEVGVEVWLRDGIEIAMREYNG